MSENSQVIRLGEHIFLEGFTSVDNASMVIMKKIIGNYAKLISEKNSEYNLTVQLFDGFEVKIILVSDGKMINTSDSDKNLFICVDKAFKKLNI